MQRDIIIIYGLHQTKDTNLHKSQTKYEESQTFHDVQSELTTILTVDGKSSGASSWHLKPHKALQWARQPT